MSVERLIRVIHECTLLLCRANCTMKKTSSENQTSTKKHVERQR